PVMRERCAGSSRSFASIDDRDHWTATLRPLVHGIDGHEDRGITNCSRRNRANCCFYVTMMMNVGIIEHNLAATPQTPRPIGLAFDEAIDKLAIQVRSARSIRKAQAGITNCVINTVDVERILHHAMANSVAATRASLVAKQNDLRLVEFNARRA